VNEAPRVERVRHELKRRRLTVARDERLPPNMVRIVLSGDELQGFTSLGFDDHIKVFFPAGIDGAATPAMRDFTPRHFDAQSGELWIDFFLHEGGPAAAWAERASAGQTLQIGGPKESAVIALDGINAHVLIGDETALPAITRRLEELPASGRALVVIETDAGVEQPVLASRAAVDVVRVVRDERSGPPAHEIIDALRRLEFPPGRCFVWVAAESRAARTIRGYLREERGLDKKWIKAAGYWQQGAAGAHDTITDEV
jgi:NADPH-dependent ferric siderophore reductase